MVSGSENGPLSDSGVRFAKGIRNLVGPPLAKRDRRAGNAGDEQIQMLTAKLLLCRDWISVKSPSAKIKEVNYSTSASA